MSNLSIFLESCGKNDQYEYSLKLEILTHYSVPHCPIGSLVKTLILMAFESLRTVWRESMLRVFFIYLP